MLHCVIRPSWGGDTEFADLRHAYDTLDERTHVQIAHLEAEHYALHTRLLLGDEAYADEQKKRLRLRCGRFRSATPTRVPAERCSSSVCTRARFSDGPRPKAGYCCSISWSMPRSANGLQDTSGRWATS